jgi:HD-GYP domain-containing protein (c-di-GMP phosphodiesterase class II)
VADTIDAMTSDRPYRKALTFQQTADEIARCSGKQFDPDIVKAFFMIPVTEWQREKVEFDKANLSRLALDRVL